MASLGSVYHCGGTEFNNTPETLQCSRPTACLKLPTMSRFFQIVTYIITYTSFPLAIASCALRIHSCRSIKQHCRKPDDTMSLIVGVRPLLFSPHTTP